MRIEKGTVGRPVLVGMKRGREGEKAWIVEGKVGRPF